MTPLQNLFGTAWKLNIFQERSFFNNPSILKPLLPPFFQTNSKVTLEWALDGSRKSKVEMSGTLWFSKWDKEGRQMREISNHNCATHFYTFQLSHIARCMRICCRNTNPSRWHFHVVVLYKLLCQWIASHMEEKGNFHLSMNAILIILFTLTYIPMGHNIATVYESTLYDYENNDKEIILNSNTKYWWWRWKRAVFFPLECIGLVARTNLSF